METLSDTVWDVVLSGTGISQSLLALALSRSGKKVLHVDRNDYYGGAEAAFSLQEVEAWVESVNTASQPSPFKNASFTCKPEPGSASALGYSRSYSISLSPQLIYTRSTMLPALISSKIYRQLEFLAVGSWWIYDRKDRNSSGQGDNGPGPTSTDSSGRLQKIPGGREDVFGDTSIDLRSTRALMKFLKLAADTEVHPAILEEWGSKPFPEFLTSHVKVPTSLQPSLLALTLSPKPPAQTITSYALPQIHRHLTSIGMFGSGFGSVIPRWGGLAEVAQVACRALAVSGGVYILKNGIEIIEDFGQLPESKDVPTPDENASPLKIRLEGGEEIQTHWIAGNSYDLPPKYRSPVDRPSTSISHSISIVSSPLSFLFPHPSEGSPPPACALVSFPTGSLGSEERPPVYLMVHSTDTGECPTGQCVIYASINHPSPSEASQLLNLALKDLLSAIPEHPEPDTLYSIFYTQEYTSSNISSEDAMSSLDDPAIRALHSRVLQLPDLPPGLALEDRLLRNVRATWEKIIGGNGEGFMQFGEREGSGNDGDEEEER